MDFSVQLIIHSSKAEKYTPCYNTMALPRGTRYSNEEILLLAKSNRGYGLERMIEIIYFENGTSRSQKTSGYYTHALDILMEHNESSGEDLYGYIQDPEMIKMVTRLEYIKVTGDKRAPKGTGHSLGGRKSKPSRKNSRGDVMLEVPLLPQNFDWVGIVPIWER